MSKEFLIGCTHFGHANIIKLTGRPFDSIADMNEGMIDRWNSTVSENDTVFHLGDFSWKGRVGDDFESALNGNIVKIRGNHDPDEWGNTFYKEIKRCGHKIILCHYPIEDWNGRYRNSLHFHAHTHKPDFVSAYHRGHIGADAIEYTPILMTDAIERLVEESKSFPKPGSN